MTVEKRVDALEKDLAALDKRLSSSVTILTKLHNEHNSDIGSQDVRIAGNTNSVAILTARIQNLEKQLKEFNSNLKRGPAAGSGKA